MASAGFLIVVFFGSRSTGADLQANSDDPGETSEVAQVVDTDIYYWSESCPYCKDTLAWMEENKIEESVAIAKKEISGDKKNSVELMMRAKSCGMDQRSVGVPFVYTKDGKCLVGMPNIVSYLAEKASRFEGEEKQDDLQSGQSEQDTGENGTTQEPRN